MRGEEGKGTKGQRKRGREGKEGRSSSVAQRRSYSLMEDGDSDSSRSSHLEEEEDMMVVTKESAKGPVFWGEDGSQRAKKEERYKALLPRSGLPATPSSPAVGGIFFFGCSKRGRSRVASHLLKNLKVKKVGPNKGGFRSWRKRRAQRFLPSLSTPIFSLPLPSPCRPISRSLFLNPTELYGLPSVIDCSPSGTGFLLISIQSRNEISRP